MQVQKHPTNQGNRSCGRRTLQVRSRQGRIHKTIDGMSGSRRLNLLDWLKRPMLSRIDRSFFVGWKFRTVVQPGLHTLDLFGRHGFAFRRHPFGFIAGRNSRQQMTVQKLFGVQSRAGVTSGFHIGNRVQPQSGFLPQSAMTRIALGFQERLDVARIIHGIRNDNLRRQDPHAQRHFRDRVIATSAIHNGRFPIIGVLNRAGRGNAKAIRSDCFLSDME